MTPFYFGAPDRHLFGVIEVPSPVPRVQRAVVLCNPFGQEYVRAHRSMRKLSEQLCEQGFTVLRFDYFGTGDSQGSSSAVSFEGFVSDLATAIDEIKEAADARSLAVVGLRLGGTVAVKALSQGRRDIERVVLWDPVIRGRSLVDEAEASPRRPRPRPPELGGGMEYMGFPWPAPFLTELAAVDVGAELRRSQVPVLAVFSGADIDGALERDALKATGSEIRSIAAPPAWIKQGEFGAGTIPVAVIDAIVDWLRESR